MKRCRSGGSSWKNRCNRFGPFVAIPIACVIQNGGGGNNGGGNNGGGGSGGNS